MPILLFDGECAFCTGFVDWLAARLERRTRLVPWQEADLDALGLTREDAARTLWWIEPDGTRQASAGAVAGLWLGLALQAAAAAAAALGMWLRRTWAAGALVALAVVSLASGLYAGVALGAAAVPMALAQGLVVAVAAGALAVVLRREVTGSAAQPRTHA